MHWRIHVRLLPIPCNNLADSFVRFVRRVSPFEKVPPMENAMFTRYVLAFVASVSAFLMSAMPAAAAEPIAGRWITEERDAIIEIGRCGSTTCGRIARFLVEPPDGADQRDVNNPEPNLRRRTLLGLPVLTQFREEEDLWRGRVYDPVSGRSYRSVIRRINATTLEVRGCLGPFCQAQTWRRAR